LHYHDPKKKFSEKDTKYFLGRNMPKLPYFEGKKSLKLTYWLLKFGSFLLQMIRIHLLHQIEKKKEKEKPLFSPLNIATQNVVVELL